MNDSPRNMENNKKEQEYGYKSTFNGRKITRHRLNRREDGNFANGGAPGNARRIDVLYSSSSITSDNDLSKDDIGTPNTTTRSQKNRRTYQKLPNYLEDVSEGSDLEDLMTVSSFSSDSEVNKGLVQRTRKGDLEEETLSEILETYKLDLEESDSDEDYVIADVDKHLDSQYKGSIAKTFIDEIPDGARSYSFAEPEETVLTKRLKLAKESKDYIPKIFKEFEKNNITWCRFCGTNAVNYWRLGPWGKATLCNSHGLDRTGPGYSGGVPRLDLTRYERERREDRKFPVLQEYCKVCFGRFINYKNLLVRCNGCSNSFHQNCKNIVFEDYTIDKEKWYCNKSCEKNVEILLLKPELPKKKDFPLFNTENTHFGARKKETSIFSQKEPQLTHAIKRRKGAERANVRYDVIRNGMAQSFSQIRSNAHVGFLPILETHIGGKSRVEVATNNESLEIVERHGVHNIAAEQPLTIGELYEDDKVFKRLLTMKGIPIDPPEKQPRRFTKKPPVPYLNRKPSIADPFGIGSRLMSEKKFIGAHFINNVVLGQGKACVNDRFGISKRLTNNEEWVPENGITRDQMINDGFSLDEEICSRAESMEHHRKKKDGGDWVDIFLNKFEPRVRKAPAKKALGLYIIKEYKDIKKEKRWRKINKLLPADFKIPIECCSNSKKKTKLRRLIIK
eukprot:GHVP01021687.1.p1 GENE.GHVP01021687.1~~GHVP01021687.1.p1  ORF type:complete len:693 (+),score=115.79 GHVP01021687.1:49-2079(+)